MSVVLLSMRAKARAGSPNGTGTVVHKALEGMVLRIRCYLGDEQTVMAVTL